jgi:uncharacterized protein YggE
LLLKLTTARVARICIEEWATVKRLAIILSALAICYAPAAAQFVPSVPGVTVYATATATTTDVLVDLTVSDKLFAKPNSAQAFAQAGKSLAAITAAAGPSATVRDDGAKGASLPAMTATTGLAENATVAVAPADLQGVVARLTAAHLTIGGMSVVARDPDALSAQALANATKIARAKATAIASADGRTLGRLVQVGPSFGTVFKDMTTSILSASPMAALMAQMQGGIAQTASVTEGGSFTFEFAP